MNTEVYEQRSNPNNDACQYAAATALEPPDVIAKQARGVGDHRCDSGRDVQPGAVRLPVQVRRAGGGAFLVDAGMSTCPICERTWLVTPGDDCMIPACGCYGTDTSAANPSRPCETCGTRHAWTCAKIAGHERRAKTPHPRRVEILPSGAQIEREAL